jgi:hypothetical protein
MRPLFRPETVETIDKIVYVSDSQKNAFVKEALGSSDVCLDGPNSKVIGNAVAPFFESMFSSAEEILAAKNCRGAYTSTPFRGLKHVAKIKELPIDVYRRLTSRCRYSFRSATRISVRRNAIPISPAR